MSPLRGLILSACLIGVVYGKKCFSCFHQEIHGHDGGVMDPETDNPACKWGGDAIKSAVPQVECTEEAFPGEFPPDYQWTCVTSETKYSQDGYDIYQVYRGCSKSADQQNNDCSDDWKRYNPWLAEQVKNNPSTEVHMFKGCSCPRDSCNGGSRIILSSLTFILVVMAMIINI